MSTSTDGQICFGYELTEDAEFPWSDDGDIETWWAKVSGMPENGNQYTWCRHNPPPVELVTHCSGEYPLFILAAAGTLVTAYRGTPKKIEALNIPHSARWALEEFVKEHGIEVEGEPCWLLSSYWG